MKQNQSSTENADIIAGIIEELADMINKGKIRDREALEEQKKKICQNKGCSFLPSNNDIKRNLTSDARQKLFGVDKDVEDIFKNAKRPNSKKPLFNYYTKDGYSRVRS